jgi:S1-C subfamily serine protease
MKLRHALLSIVALILVLGPARARFVDGEEKAVEAVKKAKPSVVRIDTMHPAAKRPGVGSGVILRHDGFILTNHHVIRNARTIHVTLANGRQYNAQLWSTSPQYDLAVLKIEAQNLPVPKFGDSSRLQLGQMAIAIGSPLRFSWTVTVGTVSAIGRQIPTGTVTYRNLIQTDAAINPGSSGGALVDSSGEVIGINTLVYTGTNEYHNAQGLGFAIPINDALRVAMALVGRTKIAAPRPTGPPWLGIKGKDVTREAAEMYDFRTRSGVLVTGVTPGGPAEVAGIKRNDVITDFAGTPVRSFKELSAAVSAHRAGDTVDVTVWGLGRTRRTVTVKLEATNP